jgi:sugar phosphate isomerase/epimerase
MIRGSILHSVSYSGSWGQQFLTVEQFVDKAAELGFDGVMLMAKRPHLSVLDWNEQALAQLRSRIENNSLHVACIAGYTNFTADLEHGDIPNREFQVHHVVELTKMRTISDAAWCASSLGTRTPAQVRAPKRSLSPILCGNAPGAPRRSA